MILYTATFVAITENTFNISEKPYMQPYQSVFFNLDILYDVPYSYFYIL